MRAKCVQHVRMCACKIMFMYGCVTWRSAHRKRGDVMKLSECLHMDLCMDACVCVRVCKVVCDRLKPLEVGLVLLRRDVRSRCSGSASLSRKPAKRQGNEQYAILRTHWGTTTAQSNDVTVLTKVFIRIQGAQWKLTLRNKNPCEDCQDLCCANDLRGGVRWSTFSEGKRTFKMSRKDRLSRNKKMCVWMFVCTSACAWAYMDVVCLTDSNPLKPELCYCVVEVCARVVAALRHYRVGLNRQRMRWICLFENTIRHNQRLYLG